MHCIYRVSLNSYVERQPKNVPHQPRQFILTKSPVLKQEQRQYADVKECTLLYRAKICKERNTLLKFPPLKTLFFLIHLCLWPPYPLSFNTWPIEVMQTAHILHPIFPTLQPLQGFCSSLCRCRRS